MRASGKRQSSVAVQFSLSLHTFIFLFLLISKASLRQATTVCSVLLSSLLFVCLFVCFGVCWADSLSFRGGGVVGWLTLADWGLID